MRHTSSISRPVFFVCMSVLCVAAVTMSFGFQSALATEPGFFQYTAEVWMGVVSLVSDRSEDNTAGNSDDELDEEDEFNDDPKGKKSDRKHRKHGAREDRGSQKPASHGRHKHKQGPSMEYGHGPEMEHGRGHGGRMPPPPPQDMRRVVMDRLDEVIAKLSRIENQLGNREGDRRSPGDARGGAEDMHRHMADGRPMADGSQMPDGMRRMIEERMQEGRKRMEEGQRRMEEARKQFKQMQQRIEKLEAEVEQLKREKT